MVLFQLQSVYRYIPIVGPINITAACSSQVFNGSFGTKHHGGTHILNQNHMCGVWVAICSVAQSISIKRWLAFSRNPHFNWTAFVSPNLQPCRGPVFHAFPWFGCQSQPITDGEYVMPTMCLILPATYLSLQVRLLMALFLVITAYLQRTNHISPSKFFMTVHATHWIVLAIWEGTWSDDCGNT